MKVYLSGPMTGLPEFNYPRFNEVSDRIREEGFDVYNPAEYPFDGPLDEFPIREAFAEYAKQICLKCNAIVLLEGWENSRGANAELSLAKICGIDVIFWDDNVGIARDNSPHSPTPNNRPG